MKTLLLDDPELMSLAASQPACAGQHFGMWAIEPRWFAEAVSAVNAGHWPMRPAADFEIVQAVKAKTDDVPVLYSRTPDGIALIRIIGQMQKGESSFGGASTIRTRQAIRAALADTKVKGIMLALDSPGGTVAGTMELGDAVFAARDKKPIHAFIEDMGASAAYWVASQASRISANATAMVGSIGTLAIIEDTSDMADKLGIKVHVISTGKFKGSFAPGSKVTDEQLDTVQEIVDDINAHFLAAVANGRGTSLSAIEKLADGRVWVGTKAQSRGLIDAVQAFDAALDDLRQETEQRAAPSSRLRVAAEYDIRIAEASSRRAANAASGTRQPDGRAATDRTGTDVETDRRADPDRAATGQLSGD